MLTTPFADEYVAVRVSTRDRVSAGTGTAHAVGTRPALAVRTGGSQRAHAMRHTEHGGWALSYNLQLSTEAQNNFIVGVAVTTDYNDTHQLEPALTTIRNYTGRTPVRLIADAGYATRDNVAALTRANVELIAPFKKESARQAGNLRRHGIAPAFGRSHFVAEGDHLRCPAGACAACPH